MFKHPTRLMLEKNIEITANFILQWFEQVFKKTTIDNQ